MVYLPANRRTEYQLVLMKIFVREGNIEVNMFLVEF